MSSFVAFHYRSIGHMGLFFYAQKGSITSDWVLPTTEIIEPKKAVLSIGKAAFCVVKIIKKTTSTMRRTCLEMFLNPLRNQFSFFNPKRSIIVIIGAICQKNRCFLLLAINGDIRSSIACMVQPVPFLVPS